MRKLLFFVFGICFAISCRTTESLVTVPEGVSVETYQTLRIVEKEELSDDGTKIIKKPAIIIIGEGIPVDLRATAIKSAQTRAAMDFSSSIEQILKGRFEQKIGVIGGESVNVIRDEMSSVTANFGRNLKPGEVIVTEKDGMYQVKAEMYIPGDYYVMALKNAASNLKDKLISDEKIKNTQEVMKAVDEIFDSSMNDLK